MKIIYAYDALCGWCYGFSPVIEQLAADHPEVEFEVLSGGMVTGSRIGPIGTVAPYIKWAYKDVENATGVKFGEAFLKGVLEDGKAIFSSLKPGYALTVAKQLAPEKALAFAARLQKAVYFDGILPDHYASYGPLAADFGFDPAQFVEQMQDAAIQRKTEEEFARVANLGVRGFPTVFAAKEGKMTLIAHGFVPYETLKHRLESLN